MKKLYGILIGLLLLTSLQGQILRYSNYTLPTPPTPPADFYDEYDTVYTAFVSKPSETIAGYQEALVYSLDTLDYWGGASAWDRMDLFYVCASHDSISGYINWVKPGTYDAHVGTTGYTWDQYEGFTGNGTNSRIHTGWIPGTHAIHYALSSAAMGVYIRTDLLEGVAYTVAGTYGGTNGTDIQFATGPVTQWRINSVSSVYENSVAATPGLFIVSRTAADACALYKNGASIEAVADAVGDALPTGEVYILDIATGTAHQVSVVFWMDGVLNATQADAINDIIETYMDAIGRGIQ
jgi:hypothetical protein